MNDRNRNLSFGRKPKYRPTTEISAEILHSAETRALWTIITLNIHIKDIYVDFCQNTPNADDSRHLSSSVINWKTLSKSSFQKNNILLDDSFAPISRKYGLLHFRFRRALPKLGFGRNFGRNVGRYFGRNNFRSFTSYTGCTRMWCSRPWGRK